MSEFQDSPKKAIREETKKRLAAISKKEFLCEGKRAAVLLCASPVWLRYKTVFLFLSMNSEINTVPLLESALKEGKNVFAPRVEMVPDAAEKLVFLRISSPEGPWRSGPFGIREPINERAARAEDFPALILAPGLAFDRNGNRLGRGGGYYDRFFAELDKAGAEYCALGFCMDFQLLDKIPAEGHDKKMDGVLTGRELLKTR